MNPALAPDALYAKSQVYIRRGFRAQHAGEFEEYQLWASLALELLGKAVLGRVHPALVADPNHYQSLFMACGKPLSPDVRTITAKTLFDRLRHVDKSFDSRHQRFCEQMSIRRNAELHSGESPFSGMKPELWEREYWGAVVALLGISDETLESWLGVDGAKAPSDIVAEASRAREWEVVHRIKRAAEDFLARYKDPKKRAEIVAEADTLGYSKHREKVYLDADADERHPCPACGARGVLLGSLVQEEILSTESSASPFARTEEEYYESEVLMDLVEKVYSADEFYCPACGLHLFGIDEVTAADLPEEFTREEEREREFGEEYMNE